MADFTTINTVYNKGTDATPDWTGTALAFGGSSGSNELRFCASGAGGTTTASASWPIFARPASGTSSVGELWAFSADTTGLKITTYTGDNTKANVLRWSWDNLGTMTAAPQFSCFANSTHTTPSAGTQPAGTNNDNITNGQATDTSSTSYMKINAWGSLLATTASNLTAGTVGTNPSATTGSAGSITTTTSDWINTHGAWQSAQGWTQYIIFGSTPAATTANTWPWTCVLFTGVNMSTGTIIFVFTLQYTYS